MSVKRNRDEEEPTTTSTTSIAAAAPRVIIDCHYPALDCEGARSAVSTQIGTVYGLKNKYHASSDLIVCGPQVLRDRMDVAYKTDKWGAGFSYETRSVAEVLESNKTNISKTDVVYLSPDALVLLDTVSPDKTYIISALQDRGQEVGQAFVSLARARELGVSARRLPLHEHVQLRTGTALTVPGVFQLLMECSPLGGTKPFEEAVKLSVPPRQVQAWKPMQCPHQWIDRLVAAGGDAQTQPIRCRGCGARTTVEMSLYEEKHCGDFETDAEGVYVNLAPPAVVPSRAAYLPQSIRDALSWSNTIHTMPKVCVNVRPDFGLPFSPSSSSVRLCVERCVAVCRAENIVFAEVLVPLDADIIDTVSSVLFDHRAHVCARIVVEVDCSRSSSSSSNVRETIESRLRNSGASPSAIVTGVRIINISSAATARGVITAVREIHGGAYLRVAVSLSEAMTSPQEILNTLMLLRRGERVHFSNHFVQSNVLYTSALDKLLYVEVTCADPAVITKATADALFVPHPKLVLCPPPARSTGEASELTALMSEVQRTHKLTLKHMRALARSAVACAFISGGDDDEVRENILEMVTK
eukprot:PhM_4_TR4140/c0_g1_i1/m.22038